MVIRPVADGERDILAWLWQLFRHDLALYVDGRPYADGRYQHAALASLSSPDVAAYLAWLPHPKTSEEAPVGFALIDGLTGAARSVRGFWTAPALRRQGVGQELAVTALGRRPGPWRIGFQHENVAAGIFWRKVATAAFGPDRWREVRQPVRSLPEVPADHVIESL